MTHWVRCLHSTFPALHDFDLKAHWQRKSFGRCVFQKSSGRLIFGQVWNGILLWQCVDIMMHYYITCIQYYAMNIHNVLDPNRVNINQKNIDQKHNVMLKQMFLWLLFGAWWIVTCTSGRTRYRVWYEHNIHAIRSGRGTHQASIERHAYIKYKTMIR